MNLTEKQKLILEGKVCPYCGKETELVDGNDYYKQKGFGMLYVCRPCNASVGIHMSGDKKGQAKGRLSNPSLRSLKRRAHLEFDRLWESKKERKEIYADFSSYMNLPEEYAHIGMLGEKSMPKVFDYCMSKGKADIRKRNAGDKCPDKNNLMECCSSACRGCPSYLHSDGVHVWCDPDVSYGVLK